MSNAELYSPLSKVETSYYYYTTNLLNHVTISVHEGECPVEPSPCVEEANTCYSDSECQDSEICCATLCEHRCVAAYPG